MCCALILERGVLISEGSKVAEMSLGCDRVGCDRVGCDRVGCDRAEVRQSRDVMERRAES